MPTPICSSSAIVALAEDLFENSGFLCRISGDGRDIRDQLLAVSC